MIKIKKNAVKILAASALVGLTACGAGKDRPTVELVQDMMDQRSLKSQDYDYKRNEPSLRTPPAGTVPRGYKPYKYAGKIGEAEVALTNPTLSANLEKSLARGQEKFRIYCGVCHGPAGQGNGSVAQYMIPKPPSLVTDRAKGFRDGRFFHIITDGYGVMGSYATQVRNEEDRWAIVNYIRKLQGK